MSAGESLSRIIAALDRAGIRYMLTGSFASSYYGIPRASQDIDFVIEADPDQLRALAAQLTAEKYYFDLAAALEAHRQPSMFNLLDLESGWKIDFIFRKSRPFSQEEFRRRTEIVFESTHVFAATAEDVIISKLEWAKLSGSQRQIIDVATVLRSRQTALDYAYLEKWIASLGLQKEWLSARNAISA